MPTAFAGNLIFFIHLNHLARLFQQSGQYHPARRERVLHARKWFGESPFVDQFELHHPLQPLVEHFGRNFFQLSFQPARATRAVFDRAQRGNRPAAADVLLEQSQKINAVMSLIMVFDDSDDTKHKYVTVCGQPLFPRTLL